MEMYYNFIILQNSKTKDRKKPVTITIWPAHKNIINYVWPFGLSNFVDEMIYNYYETPEKFIGIGEITSNHVELVKVMKEAGESFKDRTNHSNHHK